MWQRQGSNLRSRLAVRSDAYFVTLSVRERDRGRLLEVHFNFHRTLVGLPLGAVGCGYFATMTGGFAMVATMTPKGLRSAADDAAHRATAVTLSHLRRRVNVG